MRAPGRTLISRIVWSTLLVSAIAVTAMIGTVVLVLSALTEKNIDSRLEDRLSAVSATVSVGGDGMVTALETADDTIDDTSWVYSADGSLIEGPRAGPRLMAAAESLSGVRKEARMKADNRSFIAAPVRRDGSVRAVVVVETPLEPYESTRNEVVLGLVVLGFVVTGGAAALAAWTVRRTLAPVTSMAARAEDWSEHDLDSRFDATGTGDEFAHLGRTLNVLLDRVAGALRSEQQLTSELAHELRTPLTAIRGEAELGLMGDPSPAVSERLGRVVMLVDRMSTTIASLVAIARGDARAESRTNAVALVLASIEHHRVPTVSISTEDVTSDEIAAPAELALRALSPIVENALKHARTSVTFAVAGSDRVVNIIVSDDGDGIAPDDTETLFVSGRRGPDSDGAGLGLALSRRVARTLGGDVHVTSTSSPTSFTLSLPRV